MVKFKKKLKLSTENKDLDIFPNYFFGIVLTSRLKNIFGIEYPPMFCEYWDNSNRWGNDFEAANKIAGYLTEKIMKNPLFSKGIINNYYRSEKELRKVSKRVEKADLEKYSDLELAEFFKTIARHYLNVLAYGWLPVASEGFSSKFSGLLKKYLGRKLNNDERKINEYFIFLTTPRESSLRQKAEGEIVTFLNSRKKSKKDTEEFIENYLRKYQWINYDFQGPTLTKKDVLKQMKEAGNKNPQSGIKPDTIFIKNNPLYSRLFATAREFMYLKNRKQEIFFYSHFCLTKLFSEIAKRLKLSLKEVRSMVVDEIILALENGEVLKSDIKRRSKHAIFVFTKSQMEIITGEEIIREFMDKNLIKEKIKDVKELKGQTACAGKGKGLTKIINSVEEMKKMKKGDILVSSKTNPSFMGAIRKASAIITDYGGITCHAAIVSRELNKPCIIGTKIATKVLKDGDIVEVDANRGIVKILKRVK